MARDQQVYNIGHYGDEEFYVRHRRQRQTVVEIL